MTKAIQSMDFCVTSSRKGLRGSGLNLDETVLVMGTKNLPEKRSDPYLFRVYTLVARVKDNKVQIPNSEEGEGDNGYRAYLVDPRCLTRLNDEKQVELMRLLENDKLT